jgi:hypothetical protein
MSIYSFSRLYASHTSLCKTHFISLNQLDVLKDSLLYKKSSVNENHVSEDVRNIVDMIKPNEDKKFRTCRMKTLEMSYVRKNKN